MQYITDELINTLIDNNDSSIIRCYRLLSILDTTCRFDLKESTLSQFVFNTYFTNVDEMYGFIHEMYNEMKLQNFVAPVYLNQSTTNLHLFNVNDEGIRLTSTSIIKQLKHLVGEVYVLVYGLSNLTSYHLRASANISLVLENYIWCLYRSYKDEQARLKNNT